MRLDQPHLGNSAAQTSVVIAARCPQTGQLGYAFASGAFRPENFEVHSTPQNGIIVQIGEITPSLGRQILKHLSKDPDPKSAISAVFSDNSDGPNLQLLVATAQGPAAGLTGRNLKRASSARWSGHSASDNLVIAGQHLPSEEILSAMAAAFKQSQAPTTVLSERLLAAVEGAASALDERYQIRAAALSVTGEEPYPLIDLRVDADPSPIHRLRTIYTDYMDEEILLDALLPTAAHPYGIVPTQWGELKRFAKRTVFAAHRNWQKRTK
jgi:uncharacterized Ntn-hydrolase superfamily protein